MIRDASAANLLLMIAGFVIWSSAFLGLYAALSVGCAFGWQQIPIGPFSLQRAVLVGLWLLHLGAVAGLLAWAWRRSRRSGPDEQPMAAFFRRSVLAAAMVAAAITVFNYAPILGLSTCL